MNKFGMALALIAVSGAQVAAAQDCYEGRIGEGPRARRVVVERHSEDSATATILSRPVRSVPLIGTRGNHLVAADSTTWLVRTDAGLRLFARGARDTSSTDLRSAQRDDVADGFLGSWSAKVGPGGVLRLDLRLSAGPCGVIIGLFDSPDQGQKDLPATAVRRVGDSLIVEAEYMDLQLAIPRTPGDTRVATMTQRGEPTPVAISRGANALRRPQEPTGPRPYAEREVRFASTQPGIMITGAITAPRKPGRHPAVILISGSGAQDRDETIAGHRPFLVLSDRLTRAGYVVLRTDDRGVGGSSGNVLRAGFDDLAADVRGALRFLRGQPEVDSNRVGLLGHSEGGVIAPIVASADPRVAFVLLLGAPAVRGRDLLTAQRSALARAEGDSTRVIRVDSLMMQTVFDVHDRRVPDDRLGAAVDSALTRWVATLGPDAPTAARMLGARTPTQDSLSLVMWTSPWFKSIYHHDPTPYLRSLNVPTYVAIGSLDLQIPAWQSGPAFMAAFAGPRAGLLTIELPGALNHMLQRAKTGKLDEYSVIEETISPDVLASIERWILRVAPPLNR